MVPGNGVLAATSSSDGFYIVTRTDSKVDVNLVDPQTGEICKSVRLKDNWKTDDVEVRNTDNVIMVRNIYILGWVVLKMT